MAKVKTQITIVPRQAIHRALDQMNVMEKIPGDFKFLDVLPVVASKIGNVPVYVLWNKGDLAVSKVGGRDCIARLHKAKGTIYGWSI